MPSMQERLRPIAAYLMTYVLAIGILAIVGCHPGFCGSGAVEPVVDAFGVYVQHGTRRTTAGDQIPYSLFVPQRAELSTTMRHPAVVISHGFARSRRFHANTAHALAERGIIVFTPDLVSLLGGEQAQLRNIENLVDHVEWLRSRAVADGDPLFGLLDPDRIGLVGHSAGGAISFEAAMDLNQAGEGVLALMLLDGVPWARTVERAGELGGLEFATVRSEPDGCNAEGAILELLGRLTNVAEDILVVGGSHCDPEHPTDVLCRLACGGSGEQPREAYQELICAFFGEALDAPVTRSSAGFQDTLDRLAAAGRIVTTSLGDSTRTNGP